MDDTEAMRCLERMVALGIDVHLTMEGALYSVEARGYAGSGYVEGYHQKTGRLADGLGNLYEAVVAHSEKRRLEGHY